MRSLVRKTKDSSWIAAATAGCFAFAVSAAFDWTWQIPVVVLAFLLLAGTILSPPKQPRSERDLRSRVATESVLFRSRVALVVISVMGIAALVIPVSTALLLDQSAERVNQEDLVGAIASARSAHSLSPSTAAPLIQEAGILRLAGSLRLAEKRAKQATELEPVNWRNWLVLSGIQARAGQEAQARRSLREAKRLNPRSDLLNP